MQLLFVLAVVACFCVAVTAAVNKQNFVVCSAVHTEVQHSPFMQLIDEQEVEDEITHLSGRSIIGKRLSAIDFSTLEKSLEKNPYIKNAEIYYDQKHAVHAKIVQRTPLLRVINNDGVSFYLSEEQVKMPLHNTFTTKVPLAIGFVQTYDDVEGDSIVGKQLFELTQYITKDSALCSLIDHIYVNEDGSFDLVPKMCCHTVHFGKVDEKMKARFENLKTFYRDVMAQKGWGKYSRLNISIANQVSATIADGSALKDSIK